MKKHMTRNAVKKSFDDLPTAICFFNADGIPVLCNRQMHRLVFSMTGRDLQMRTDLETALERADEAGVILLPEGTAWQFKVSTVTTDEEFTQFVAGNVTELYERKKALEVTTAQYREMVADMKRITENVVAITREEEILTMKMHVHSDVGVCLQRLRRYHCQPDVMADKPQILLMLRQLTDLFWGEIGNDDIADTLQELLRIAKSLGVTVEMTGRMPSSPVAEKLMVQTIRECVTNTLKHAGGDRLFVELAERDGYITAVITNNGKQPGSRITEGGGLSTLRRRIEKEGGTMAVRGIPGFALTVTVPEEREAAYV